MTVGTCRHCGYAPVAQGASNCPKCGGIDPCALTGTTRIVKLTIGLSLLAVGIAVLVFATEWGFISWVSFLVAAALLLDVLRNRGRWG